MSIIDTNTANNLATNDDSSSTTSKEYPDNRNSIHPSAMPTPLYGNHNRHVSAADSFIAPPEDILTHFDVMNSHIMRSTHSIHHKLDACNIDVIHELRKAHAESLSSLNEQFAEVFERVRTVEHNVGRVVGTVSDSQESITQKLESLANTIQTDFVRRLDEVLFAQTEMARKVDNIADSLTDVQEKQRFMIEFLKRQAMQHSMYVNGNQNQNPQAFNFMSAHHASGYSSPAPTFAGLNTPSDYANQNYAALARHYSSPQTAPAHPPPQPPQNYMHSMYGNARSSNNQNYPPSFMLPSDSDLNPAAFFQQLQQAENLRSNGTAKANGGHENGEK